MKLKLAIVALIAWLTSAVNSTVAAEPVLSGLKTDIEFAKVGDVSLTLDTFVPEGAGPFPTCILVHGGGFTKRNKQSYLKPLSESLSKTGFAWLTVNYRLAPQHRWPACAEDVETAIRWVKSHAKEHKVDVSRIALIGESAAHPAAPVSLRGTDVPQESTVSFSLEFFDYPLERLREMIQGIVSREVAALSDTIEIKSNSNALNGIPRNAFLQLSNTDRVPRPVRLGFGNCIRWSMLELVEWIIAGCPRKRSSLETRDFKSGMLRR